MRDLAALAALYVELDTYLDDLRVRSETNGDMHAAEKMARKQQFNDQAYFVLCWGQLEIAIDDVCRTAVRARRASSSWSARRAWDRYNPEDKRLSGLAFEDRAALVLDRQGGPGSPWTRVLYYYSLRNQIAQGKLRSDRLNVSNIVNELYQIQSALTP